MKDRVVCIKKPRFNRTHKDCVHLIKLVKVGEIYTILTIEPDGYITLVEFGDDASFNDELFRPVDLSYGPAICETIEQQIELEKVLI